jgi:hypothetical protein
VRIGGGWNWFKIVSHAIFGIGHRLSHKLYTVACAGHAVKYEGVSKSVGLSR